MAYSDMALPALTDAMQNVAYTQKAGIETVTINGEQVSRQDVSELTTRVETFVKEGFTFAAAENAHVARLTERVPAFLTEVSDTRDNMWVVSQYVMAVVNWFFGGDVLASFESATTVTQEYTAFREILGNDDQRDRLKRLVFERSFETALEEVASAVPATRVRGEATIAAMQADPDWVGTNAAGIPAETVYAAFKQMGTATAFDNRAPATRLEIVRRAAFAEVAREAAAAAPAVELTFFQRMWVNVFGNNQDAA